MELKRPLVYLIVAAGLTALGSASAGNNDMPPSAAIDAAEETADLLQATVLTALVQEISETTPENAAQGTRSISLVFNDHNHDMRLVGTFDPLKDNDYPEDAFEESALAIALQGDGATNVERVKGKWYYRRSIPLSNFHPACAMCHANFAAMPSSQLVGALMLRVPIEGD